MYHRNVFYLVSIVVALLALTGPASAEAHLDRFFGAYVGSGTAVHPIHGHAEVRALDVTVEPNKKDGFRIKWITVIHPADGPVGHPIKRREIEENFVPSDWNGAVFISAPKGGMFTKAELPNPLAGEPMRWAAVDGDALTVYSAGISEKGAFETQIYRRTLTENGLDVVFLRLENERVMLRADGRLTKTE